MKELIALLIYGIKRGDLVIEKNSKYPVKYKVINIDFSKQLIKLVNPFNLFLTVENPYGYKLYLDISIVKKVN